MQVPFFKLLKCCKGGEHKRNDLPTQFKTDITLQEFNW